MAGINYTAEQTQRFSFLYKRLLEDCKRIEELRTKPSLSNPVFARRIAFRVLGQDIPEYERQVPEEIQREFNFDIEGLVKIAKSLL